MVQIVKYFKEVREELVKVTWPSRQQTLNKTGLVILVSVIVGLYIGALDFLFTFLAQTILK